MQLIFDHQPSDLCADLALASSGRSVCLFVSWFVDAWQLSCFSRAGHVTFINFVWITREPRIKKQLLVDQRQK